MDRKPTYEELEQRIRDLEGELQEGKADSSAQDTRTAVALEILRQRERMLHDLLNATTDSIYLLDIEGNFLVLNEIAARRFGRTVQELKGICAWNLLPPDVARARKTWFDEVIREGRPIRVEDHRQGRWIDNRIFPIFDKRGEVAAVAVFARDITENKRAEEALRESEERYRNFVENASEGIFRIDLTEPVHVDEPRDILEEKIVGCAVVGEVNAALADRYKLRPEQMIGRHVREFTPNCGAQVRDLSEAKDYRIIDREEMEYTAEGRPVYIVQSYIGIVDKGILKRVWGVQRDITERKTAEEALRKSEERHRNILESIEEGYYEVDLAGNFTFFNDSVCELLGHSRNELMGMNDRRYTDPENARKLFKAFNEVYGTGKPTKGFDWEIIRKDGTRRFVEASVSLIRDTEGKPTGFRGITRDVTARKEAEKERERLEAQLQQARKLEAIGTLAGGLAHDFNNLLMGIQGRTSLMLVSTDRSDPHFEHLCGIEEYVKSATDLTRQLLGFARGGRYEVKPTDLNELADRSATLFGRTRKEISIFRKFQPGLWPVEVDRHQIEQVLLNLYVNAWQAMPAGGDLYIQTENVVLEEHDGKSYDLTPDRYAKLSVTDTGVGMDEATRQRIFDPFFTTREMGRGTGLGLASAYGIIKNHKGIITVSSEKGYGSTFNIYLPATEKGVSREKEPALGLVRGEGTVLLVDDEEMILEVGRPMLENLGYEVLEARGGEEAVEIYRQYKDRVRVVVLDMVMPQMSGGQTFDQLKAINPGVKVLLSSGYSVDGKAQEIMNRGCDGFIQKPFGYIDLSRKLSEILEEG